MKQCCMCADTNVEWHHNLIYGGRQSDDPHSILPLCKEHHAMADDMSIKEELDWCMFQLKNLDVTLYPKSDLAKRKKYLIHKYGI